MFFLHQTGAAPDLRGLPTQEHPKAPSAPDDSESVVTSANEPVHLVQLPACSGNKQAFFNEPHIRQQVALPVCIPSEETAFRQPGKIQI